MSENQSNAVKKDQTASALSAPPTTPVSVAVTPISSDTALNNLITAGPPASKLKAPTNFGGSATSLSSIASGVGGVSKIGRLCSHAHTPKAGPPPRDTKSMSRESDDNLSSINSAYTDMYQETVKRFTRSSLSPEMDRYSSTPSRMSTKSPSQKSDPDRRFSFDLYVEATGRRRSSDHGAVLTADTEQFIIGQRVWVGGARPGQIAYIGETHFAPGDWAGIVLDEPNGKNDGCVAGKRYFQCEPKRGIFSRLTRLTLAPLPGAIPPSSPLSKYTPDRSHTVSPTASVQSSALRSPGKNGLTVGDRVIVSSGFGSRPGILRYLGETQFASGNWCGIELDEATGKNDGSVDGIRYFECQPKYGVFVPIAKVSLSPLTKKSRLSRTGSRESLTSIGTMNSVATTNTSRLRMSAQRKPSSIKPVSSTPKSQFSMQDLLREKQNHIEQLMIERDLDREDAQNQALQFQKNISELKGRITDLERKLSDERKKTEDLQFSIDEATFCGDELNAQTQVYKEKIHLLETKISKLSSGTQSLNTPSESENLATTEAQNAQILELISKLSLQASEHESQIANVREEEKRLQDQIVYLKSENDTLKQELLEKDESLEKFSLSESGIENLRKELALLKEENERERQQLIADNSQRLSDKLEELKQLTEELSALRSSLVSIESERGNVEDECEILRAECKTRDEQVRLLNEQVSKVANELGEQRAENARIAELLKTQQLNGDESKTSLQKKISENAKLNDEIVGLQNGKAALEAELKKSLEELKKFGELQKKYQELLDVVDELKKQQHAYQTGNENLSRELKNMENLKNVMEAAKDELQQQLKDKTDAHQSSSTELRESQEKAADLEKQLANISAEMQKALTEKDAEIQNFKAATLVLQEKAQSLKGESSAIVQQMREKNSTLEAQINQLQHSLKSNESQLEVQRQTTVKQEAALAEKNAELSKSTAALESTTKIMEQLKQDLDSTQSKAAELEAQLKESDIKGAQQELQLGDLRRQHEALIAKFEAVTVSNETLQQEISALRTSAVEIQENIKRLNEEISAKQYAYDELKHTGNTMQHKLESQIEELEQKLENSNKTCEELNLQLQKSKEELAKQNQLTIEWEEKSVKQELIISDAARQQEHLQMKYNALTEQNVSLQNDLTSLRSSSTDSSAELLKLSQDVAAKQKAFEELLDKSGNERGVLESQLQASQQRIDALCNQVETLTQELKSTTEESFRRFEQLKQTEEIRGKLELDLSEATRKIEALSSKTESLEQQNSSLQSELSLQRTTSADANSEVLKLTEVIVRHKKTQQELSEQANSERLILESQLQELSQRNATAQTELETLRNELKSTIDGSTQNATEFESLKAELNAKAQKQQEDALAERKALRDSFEQQLQSAEKTKIKLDEAISSLQQQIELLQGELLKSQLDFKAKEHELSRQLSAVVQEKDQLQIILQQLQTAGDSTQQEKAELLQRLESLRTQLKQKEDELLAASSEAEQHKLARTNANLEMAKLETQLQTLQNSLERTTSELSFQSEISQAERTKINELKDMLETLQQSNANISATNAELSETLQLIEKEKCETSHNFELFELEADQNLAQLQEVRNQLEQQLASTQEALQSKTAALTEAQANLQQVTVELQASQGSLEIVQARAVEDATRLSELDVAKSELVTALTDKETQIQNLTANLNANAEKCNEQEAEMRRLREELEKLEAALPSAEDIQKQEELEFQLAEYKQVVDEMDDASSENTSQLSVLQERLQQVGAERQAAVEAEKARAVECLNLQRKLESLESEKMREIVALQSRITDLQSLSKLKQNGGGDPSSSVIDDGDSIAQINFLNSIIADMQKKNDMLKAKIEALEALPTDFTKSNAFDWISKRKPAPRVFCDICDEFDKHETEDCPLQASDDLDYLPQPTKTEKNNNDPNKPKERILPEPRKYCESCEVFGHETGECDDECF